MKILVKNLWFRHSVDRVMDAMFRIPQMKEQFDEGYKYDGEMRPRGAKIIPGYWNAHAIMDKLSRPGKDVYLILTSLDLKGDYGRIRGKGREGVAIMSSSGLTGKLGLDYVFFNATAFGEVGHALGLEHHEFDPSNPCEMSHDKIPCADWKSLESVRFCDDCYRTLK